MILYIAGPMTGLPELNYPAFNQAEAQLRALGYGVLNPVRHDNGIPRPWLDYLFLGMRDVMVADGVALLHDYETSKGAIIEQKLAQVHDKPTCSLSLWLVKGMA